MSIEAMNPERAAYFMRRFKHDEKMLGPNEQSALDFVVAMLEQAQKQEPVAGKHYYLEYVGFGRWVKCDKETYDKTQELCRMSVYTSPPASVNEAPQRQPLTDEQISDMIPNRTSGEYSFDEMVALARAIESAHGITGEKE